MTLYQKWISVVLVSIFVQPGSVAVSHSHPGPGPRLISGNVVDVQAQGLADIRLVGQCLTRDGRQIDIAVETDANGQFVVWPLPEGQLSCFLTTNNLVDGLVSAHTELVVGAGDSATANLLIEPGLPVNVAVQLGAEPATSGNILFIDANRAIVQSVKEGRAHFSGLPPDGRLFYVGRRQDFPSDARAGCKLIAAQDSINLDPDTDSEVVINVDAARLRDVRVSMSALDPNKSLVMYLAGARAAGMLSGISTGSGSDVVFPCVDRQIYELAIRIGNEFEPVKTVDLREGTGPLELVL